MKKIVFLVLSLLLVEKLAAQDQQYTQFYSAPNLLNPAFAGVSAQSRVAALYRNQWSLIPGGFKVQRFSYDQYVPNLKSGFGLVMGSEKAGSGGLKTSSAQFQYAYEVRIKKKVFFRPALQLGYVSRTIDFNKLTFYDQLIREGDNSSFEDASFGPVHYFDASAGFLFYSDKAWAGLSLFHMNTPNEVLYSGTVSSIPSRLSVHGGVRKHVKSNYKSAYGKDFVFAFNYQAQGKYDQLDLGFYTELEPIVLGLWYRGLPLKQNGYLMPNRDMLAILFGFQWGAYKLGYSYDITTSNLSLGNTGGSHEVSLTYQWANKRNLRKVKRRVVPCAKF
jgi:type IX secretion system PorP/SprF family membrane protein